MTYFASVTKRPERALLKPNKTRKIMASLKEMVAAKKAQIAEQTGKRESAARLKPGKNRIRILPSWRGRGELQFWHDFGQHFIRNAKGEMQAVYVCSEKTHSKPCSLCDSLRDAMNLADTDEQKDLIKSALANGRVLVNALFVEVDRNTPVVLELSPTTFDKVLDIYQVNVDENDDNFNIVTDLKNGVDLVITRTGTGKNTEYGVQPAMKGNLPVDESVLDKLHDLDKYVAQETELGLAKATAAARALIDSSRKALPRADDSAFEGDDDVPEYTSPAAARASKVHDADDAIEGDYKAATSDMSDDELNSLLDELE